MVDKSSRLTKLVFLNGLNGLDENILKLHSETAPEMSEQEFRNLLASIVTREITGDDMSARERLFCERLFAENEKHTPR